MTDVLHDGLVYKIRHDATGFASNVFVGRLIPCETRVMGADDADFPAPLNRDDQQPVVPSVPAQHSEQAESGAENAELSDSDMVLGEDDHMVVEDEEGKWEP